jgi:C1A family cysteine protease
VHTAANLETMKTLLNRGIPFVAGLRIYESFDSKVVESTGVVPMPKTKKEKYKGRHAVVFAGYDDEKYGGSFFVGNSWGKKWVTSFNGKDDVNGYCWLPYKYATNPSLSRDFWTISKMVVQEKADLSDDDANTSNSCWEFFFEKRKN